MAADNFAHALALVQRLEGGYANHPADPGGETMYGITRATARAHGYRGPMRAIPQALVARIYRTGYWEAVGADALPAGLDLCVFDAAVHSGPARARAWLGEGMSVDAYCDARLAWLRRLKTWPVFGRGWQNRLAAVRAEARALAGEGAR